MRKTGSQDRRPDGRFRKGHSIKSPGNPQLVAMRKFREALDATASPEEAAGVMAEFLAIARGEPKPTESNSNPPPPSYSDRIAAGRAYLERVAGKPVDPPVTIPEGLFDFDLTDARSALDAAGRVTEAAARGDIDLTQAKALSDLFDVVGKRELVSLAERVQEVEAIQQERRQA